MARANLNPLILEVSNQGSTDHNFRSGKFSGFPEGVDGFSLMDQLRKQATKFGARVENAFIDKVDFSGETSTFCRG